MTRPDLAPIDEVVPLFGLCCYIHITVMALFGPHHHTHAVVGNSVENGNSSTGKVGEEC